MNKNIVDVIKNATASGSLYFFLPDGPYGRPNDNQYWFEDVAEKDGELHLKLKADATFVFSGPVNACFDGTLLSMTGFSKLVFSPDGRTKRVYSGGEVLIHLF